MIASISVFLMKTLLIDLLRTSAYVCLCIWPTLPSTHWGPWIPLTVHEIHCWGAKTYFVNWPHNFSLTTAWLYPPLGEQFWRACVVFLLFALTPSKRSQNTDLFRCLFNEWMSENPGLEGGCPSRRSSKTHSGSVRLSIQIWLLGQEKHGSHSLRKHSRLNLYSI